MQGSSGISSIQEDGELASTTITDASSESNDVARAAVTCVFILIVLLSTLSSYMAKRINFRYATEGSISLLLGLAAGGVIYLYCVVFTEHKTHVPRKLIEFNEDVFFQVLLPPIIFYAGFSVKKKLFFQNFVTLMVFGVIGTMVCAGIIACLSFRLMSSMELPHAHLLTSALALGAIFSSSDTVATLQIMDKNSHPVLYSLVFGEGVVNDATAIALLTATTRLSGETLELGWTEAIALLLDCLRLFTLSALLGVALGMVSAFTVRWVFSQHHSTEREVLVVALIGSMAYYVAEALDLSAILAVFMCGITMSHYTWHSLSPNAQVITRHGFAIIANSMEMVLFVYSGLDMWVTALWPNPLYSSAQSLQKILLLACGLLLFVILARAAFIFPACCLANLTWRRAEPLSVPEMAVIWWGGLSRGAITLALVYHFFYDDFRTDPDYKIIIAAAVVIVLITTVGFGTFTVRIMEFMLPRPKSASASSASLAPLHDTSAHDRSCHHHHQQAGPQEQRHLGQQQQQPAVAAPAASPFAPAAAAATACDQHQHQHEHPQHAQQHGGLTEPLLPSQGGAAGGHESPRLEYAASMSLFARMSDLDDSRTWVHRQWRKFDALYLQPLFGGRIANEMQQYNPRGTAGVENMHNATV